MFVLLTWYTVPSSRILDSSCYTVHGRVSFSVYILPEKSPLVHMTQIARHLHLLHL